MIHLRARLRDAAYDAQTLASIAIVLAAMLAAITADTLLNPIRTRRKGQRA